MKKNLFVSIVFYLFIFFLYWYMQKYEVRKLRSDISN